jgi:hypothetical protein
MITTDDETYVPTKDSDGNDYFCPARVVDSVGRISSADAETCVEAEVAGRYAGLVTG